MMDLVLGDILIFSKDLSSHVDNFQEVFRLCWKHCLTMGLPKCEFAVSKTSFLAIYSPPLVVLL